MKRRENQRIAPSRWKARKRHSSLQQPGGFWLYPLPERKHLIATVEGNWAAIGLLATLCPRAAKRIPGRRPFAGTIIWWGLLDFKPHTSGEAINYFDKPRGKIPNNSVEAVWLFLRLWKATGDARFLGHVDCHARFSGKYPASHRRVALHRRGPL